MRLADLERVRLLDQRRQKLLLDIEAVKAGEFLLLELTPPAGSSVVKPFKISVVNTGAITPETDDEALFDAVTQVLDLSLAKRVAEIERELVQLGVVLT